MISLLEIILYSLPTEGILPCILPPLYLKEITNSHYFDEIAMYAGNLINICA